MDKVNEYLNRTRNTRTFEDGYVMEGIRPAIRCKDGFQISVQASEFHYCSPRINGADEYKSVELGFPNYEDLLILPYAEDPCNPTHSIYGNVPIEIVNELIEKHGGIVN